MGIVLFLETGIWIHLVDSERFKFNGTPDELISILIKYTELDINEMRFLVHVPSNME